MNDEKDEGGLPGKWDAEGRGIDFELPGQSADKNDIVYDKEDGGGDSSDAEEYRQGGGGRSRKKRLIITAAAVICICLAIILIIFTGGGEEAAKDTALLTPTSGVLPSQFQNGIITPTVGSVEQDGEDEDGSIGITPPNVAEYVPVPELFLQEVRILAGGISVEYCVRSNKKLQEQEDGTGPELPLDSSAEDLTAELIRRAEEAGGVEALCYGEFVDIDFLAENVTVNDIEMSVYTLEGEPKGDASSCESIPFSPADGKVSFRIKKNKYINLDADASIAQNGYYQLYTVKCEWPGNTEDYSFLVRIGTDADAFTATVLATSPELIVQAGPDSWLYSEPSIMLTGPRLVEGSRDGRRISDKAEYVLEKGDAVRVYYPALNIGGTFPSKIDSCTVVVEERPAVADGGPEPESISLRSLIESCGRVSEISYPDISAGLESYNITDKTLIEAVMKYLDNVRVYEADEEDAGGEQGIMGGADPSSLMPMLQLAFSFEDSDSKVVIKAGLLVFSGTQLTELYAALPGGESDIMFKFDSEASARRMSAAELLKLAEVLKQTADEADRQKKEYISRLGRLNYRAVETSMPGNSVSLSIGNSYSIDLDGDGADDKLYLSRPDWLRDPVTYTCDEVVAAVNGKLFVMSDYGMSDVNNYYSIIDIDTSDAYREFVFVEADSTAYFYRYEDGDLHCIGRIDGANGNISADGSGIVKAEKWVYVVFSGAVTVSYELGDDDLLHDMGEELYETMGFWAGVECRALTDITLFSDMSTESATYAMPAGQLCRFLKTDGEHWVLVEYDEDRKRGWIYADGFTLTYNAGQPQADEALEALDPQ